MLPPPAAEVHLHNPALLIDLLASRWHSLPATERPGLQPYNLGDLVAPNERRLLARSGCWPLPPWALEQIREQRPRPRRLVEILRRLVAVIW